MDNYIYIYMYMIVLIHICDYRRLNDTQRLNPMLHIVHPLAFHRKMGGKITVTQSRRLLNICVKGTVNWFVRAIIGFPTMV